MQSTSRPGHALPAQHISQRRSHWASIILFAIPGAIIYILFVVWPILQVIRLSLDRWNGYGIHQFVGLANFSALWNDVVFRSGLEHSVLWEIGAAIVPTILGLSLAALARRAWMSSFFLAALFFPVLLPATVVATVWTLVYSPVSGPLNAVWRNLHLYPLAQDWLGDPHLALEALFVAWLWSSIGVATTIFRAALRSVAQEYIDTALLEGAGPVARYLHVVIPSIHRPIVVITLINIALGAQAFDLVFVTTGGGPGYATMILPIDMYGRAFGGEAGQGAAVACIQVAIGLILTTLTVLLFGGAAHPLDSGSTDTAVRHKRWFPTGVLLFVLVIWMLPLLWLFVTIGQSATTPGSPSPTPVATLHFVAWDNLVAVWDAGMGHAIATSVGIAACVVLTTLVLAVPLAFILAHQTRLIPSYIVAFVLVTGLLQPLSVSIIPLFSLLKDLQMLDSVWGIILPEIGRALPFTILLLWGFMLQSPREILEAAEVDGASPLQRLIHIAVPLLHPALAAAAIWSFALSWNEYFLPTVVSQDGSLQTVPTLLATFIGKFNTQFGLLAAGAAMAMFPPLLLYVMLQRPATLGLSRLDRSDQG